MWVREREREKGVGEKQRGEERCSLCMCTFVSWPSPGVGNVDSQHWKMSCVCLNGEGNSFVAGSNAGFYDCILNMEVAYIYLCTIYIYIYVYTVYAQYDITW